MLATNVKFLSGYTRLLKKREYPDMINEHVKIAGTKYYVQTELQILKGNKFAVSQIFFNGHLVYRQGMAVQKLRMHVDKQSIATETALLHYFHKAVIKKFEKYKREERERAFYSLIINTSQQKEGKEMVTKQEAIDKILSSLSQIEGSEGAALISKDGMIIASRFDKKYAEDKMAALISHAVATANKVISEAQMGQPDTMLIEGSAGKIAIISAPNGAFFIAMVGRNELNLGMARMSLDDAMEDLSAVLK